MKFGNYIRQIREKNGWTQPEAAARANIEQSYLSKLETGKSYPSEDIFERLITAYDMNPETLCRSVFSAELDKLRDIKQVRSIVLSRQQSESRLMRGWLIAGLVMVMLGGGMLGLAASIPSTSATSYLYRSEGVIKDGESPMTFEFLAAGRPDKDQNTLSDRIDYDFKTLEKSHGKHFIEQVEGGFRKYTLYDTKEDHHPTAISWHYSLGFMFLFGGFACFYIARRWR